MVLFFGAGLLRAEGILWCEGCESLAAAACKGVPWSGLEALDFLD